MMKTLTTVVERGLESVLLFVSWPHVVTPTRDMPVSEIKATILLILAALICQALFVLAFVMRTTLYLDIEEPWTGRVMIAALVVYFTVTIIFGRVQKTPWKKDPAP